MLYLQQETLLQVLTMLPGPGLKLKNKCVPIFILPKINYVVLYLNELMYHLVFRALVKHSAKPLIINHSSR